MGPGPILKMARWIAQHLEHGYTTAATRILAATNTDATLAHFPLGKGYIIRNTQSYIAISGCPKPSSKSQGPIQTWQGGLDAAERPQQVLLSGGLGFRVFV